MASLSDKLRGTLTFQRIPPVKILFGPWLPDLPSFGSPGLTIATNAIPSQVSYRPFQSLVTQSGALASRALGAVAAKTTAGDTYFYVGNAAKLYSIQNQTVTDDSIAGGYSTSAGEGWEFATFGSTLIATNYDDAVQSITIGGAGLFANHFTSTLKPKARHIGIVRDFVVLGNTNDGTDGVRPNRVWWSGINDSLDMDPNATTQSDFQDLPEGGAVQKVVAGVEYGLIFQENMIRRITYVGSPLVFSLNPFDRQRGTPIPNSVIAKGREVFYITEEGFYITDGSASYPIGDEQVDREFWGQFDIANADRVSAALDPVNKLVMWAFPGAGASAGAPNRIFTYNYQHKKWAQTEIDTEIITSALTQGFTLEELDAVFLDSTADTTLDGTEIAAQTVISVTDETLFGVGNAVRIDLDDGTIHQANIDSIGTGTITIDVGLPSQATSGNRAVRTSIDAPGYASFDSPQWQGGKYRLAAFDAAHKLAYFTGDNLAATFETGEIQINPSGRSKVRKLRPLVDGTATVTVDIASRAKLSATASYDGAASLDTPGEAAVLNDGRYHKIRVSIASGAWTHAQGVEVIFGGSGQR